MLPPHRDRIAAAPGAPGPRPSERGDDEDGDRPLDDAGHEPDLADEDEGDSDELTGLPVGGPEDDLGALDDEVNGDDDRVVGDDGRDALDLDEDDERADDDAPGPAAAEDDRGELDALEDEPPDDDRLPEAESDDDVGELDGEADEDDGGSEGIEGEDPSAAIDEHVPELDGAEGEDEGTGEALPELDDGTFDR